MMKVSFNPEELNSSSTQIPEQNGSPFVRVERNGSPFLRVEPPEVVESNQEEVSQLPSSSVAEMIQNELPQLQADSSVGAATSAQAVQNENSMPSSSQSIQENSVQPPYPPMPQGYPLAGAAPSVPKGQDANSASSSEQPSNPVAPYIHNSPYFIPGVYMMPKETRNLRKEDKKVQKLSPRIVDDLHQCCTYVVHLEQKAAQKLDLTLPTDDIQTLINNAEEVKIEEIGSFYLHSAQQFGNQVQLTVEYKVNESERRKVVFSIPEKVYLTGDITDWMRQNRILCFNPDMSNKKISEYLRQDIKQKLCVEDTPPQVCGFGTWKGKHCFISAETCQSLEIPEVTVKHFDTNCNQSFEEIGNRFINLSEDYSEPWLFFISTLIRVTGLLTTPLSETGILFDRIVCIKGEAEEILPCLRVYDRDKEFQKTYRINVREKEFISCLENVKDDVLVFCDASDDSKYKKKQGKENLDILTAGIIENYRNCKAMHPFIPVIISSWLEQELENDNALLLDFSDLWAEYSTDDEIMLILYDFDRKLVNRICSEMEDFQQKSRRAYDRWKTYIEDKNILEAYADKRCFAVLMSVAELLIWYYPVLTKKFSVKNIAEYLIKTIRVSRQYSSSGDMTQEFMQVLNRLIDKDEIELRRYSKISDFMGYAAGNKPIAWLDGDYLYLPDEAFETVSEWMQLSPTSCAVRKQLRDKHLLHPGNELKIKRNLYGNRQHVTAVKSSILQSRHKLLGGIFNFIPCKDDNSRVPVGTNEEGRMVYLSPFHSDLKNRHIEIIGDSGTGKSTVANQIARHLYQLEQNIIYVDFSNSNTRSKMISHGYSEEFYDEHISEWNISEIPDTDDLKIALEEMQEEKKILIFRDTRHSDTTEQFLTMLYNTVAADENLSVTLVIDEVHELNCNKGSALYYITEMGRGNGISLVSIFQGPHEMKRKQFTMLNQSAVKLIFGMSDANDAHECAVSVGVKPVTSFKELLGTLPKQTCLVTGSLEDEEGNLSTRRFAVVRIQDVN